MPAPACPCLQEVVAGLLGLASAVIDNVPLVAATMAMYDLNVHPMDDQLWQVRAAQCSTAWHCRR